MSPFYSLKKSFKACLFTVTIYGWLVPTVWISDQVDAWISSRQLTSTDWVIESGVPNTSWDLLTTDAQEEIQTEEDLDTLTPTDPIILIMV